MNKFAILTCLLSLSLISCSKLKETNLLTEHCRDFSLEDNFEFHAMCKKDLDYEDFSLDLNECLGAKNAILEYPSKDLEDYCESCEIKDEFHLYCHCRRSMLDELRNRTRDDDELTLDETLRDRDFFTSYFDFRNFIRFENGELRC